MFICKLTLLLRDMGIKCLGTEETSKKQSPCTAAGPALEVMGTEKNRGPHSSIISMLKMVTAEL